MSTTHKPFKKQTTKRPTGLDGHMYTELVDGLSMSAKSFNNHFGV